MHKCCMTLVTNNDKHVAQELCSLLLHVVKQFTLNPCQHTFYFKHLENILEKRKSCR